MEVVVDARRLVGSLAPGAWFVCAVVRRSARAMLKLTRAIGDGAALAMGFAPSVTGGVQASEGHPVRPRTCLFSVAGMPPASFPL